MRKKIIIITSLEKYICWKKKEKKEGRKEKKEEEREFGKLKYRCIREKRGNLYIGKKKSFLASSANFPAFFEKVKN